MALHERSVFVTGVDEDATPQDLVDMFKGISKVQKSAFVLNTDGSQTDRAYVVLQKKEDVMSASMSLSKDGVTVQSVGEALITEFDVLMREEEMEEKFMSFLSAMTPGAKMRIMSRIGASPAMKPRVIKPEPLKAAPSTNLYASGSFDTPYQHVVHEEPKISAFSGTPGRDASFGRWRYEVRCLMMDKRHPEHAVLTAARRSLRSPAADVLVRLGASASLECIIGKLQSLYGNVLSGEDLLEKFYSASQKGHPPDKETCAQWSNRLEDLIYQAAEKGAITRESIPGSLKKRFWSGLFDPLIKSDLRHRLDDHTFEEILLEARSLEEEYRGSSQKPKSSQVTESSGTSDQKLDQILKRMDQLDQEIRELKKHQCNSKPPTQQKDNVPVKCRKCQKEGHLDWGCRSGSDITCNRCAEKGHISKACRNKRKSLN